MKFTETKFNQHLCEINQSLDVKFAFVQRIGVGHYTNIHPFVKCRDFLGDAIYAQKSKKPVSIYGFSFNPKKQKHYTGKTMLCMQFPTKESLSNFVKNVSYLAEFHKKSKTPQSIVTLVDKTTLIVETSNFWQKSVAALSLYTFVLKSCAHELDQALPFKDAVSKSTAMVENWMGEKKQQATTESSYMSQVYFYWDTLVANIKSITKGIKHIQGNPYTKINSIHNSSGFVHVTSALRPDNPISVKLHKLLAK